jgi:hypothetical protein
MHSQMHGSATKGDIHAVKTFLKKGIRVDITSNDVRRI